MPFYEQSDDYRPLFWVGGRPVYVNTVLLILHILAFAITALMVSFMGGEMLGYLGLGNYEVLHLGQVWRLVSYIIFPPATAISFIFAMGFLFYFGRQVEAFVGRKTYIGLYSSLVLIPSIVLTLLGFIGFWHENYMGGYGTVFGVFVAFATIYPGVEIRIWFVDLSAKWWAFVLLGALSMAFLASHDWISLGFLWGDALIGYGGMRWIGAGHGFEWLTDWIEEKRAERLARARNFKIVEEKKATESIDAILEKISKHGVASLDASERNALERARTDLLKRDKR